MMRFATFKGHFRNVGSGLGGDKDTDRTPHSSTTRAQLKMTAV